MSRPVRRHVVAQMSRDVGRFRATKTDGDGFQKGPGGVMFRPEEQDGETRLYLLQVSTDGEPLVVGEGSTDDGEVIASDGGAPHGAIDGAAEVGDVTGLG